MSRYYNMQIRVHDFKPDKAQEIRNAVEEEWDVGDWHEGDASMEAGGDGSLCGGTSEDEFARHIAETVWDANDGYCEVEVTATYM